MDPTDSGIYTCRSSNASYSFDLQVAVVPYFIEQPLEKLTVQRNETVVLDCSAKGYPKPKVSKIEIVSSTCVNQQFELRSTYHIFVFIYFFYNKKMG